MEYILMSEVLRLFGLCTFSGSLPRDKKNKAPLASTNSLSPMPKLLPNRNYFVDANFKSKYKETRHQTYGNHNIKAGERDER